MRAILLGTFFLGPWEATMMEISGGHGIAALNDSSCPYSRKMNFVLGVLQTIVLMVAVFISIFKPCGKKETKLPKNKYLI